MVLLHDSVIVVLAVSKVLLKEARESLPQHIADLYGNVDKLFMGKAFFYISKCIQNGKVGSDVRLSVQRNSCMSLCKFSSWFQIPSFVSRKWFVQCFDKHLRLTRENYRR